MTIELRQLLIRSRVGDDGPGDVGRDTAPGVEGEDDSPALVISDSLLDELDEWKRHFADQVKSPRER